MGEERLQKILAQAGIASRRRAEEMIRAGRVKIDGQLVDKLGVKVNPALNKIEVNGKPVLLKTKHVYLAFYKPVGVVTTAHDPQGRLKISDFLSEISERVFPAGRLDLDSEGLLLLTNDGQLAYRLTHPRYKVPKIYAVSVSGA
ncbi:MAG: pseudouridine synthase, partial [Firmicutes bacterium]|nr:pseudouridine synthase [Bacillota bacterium]